MKLGFLGGGIDSIAGPVHIIASQMDGKFEVIGGIFSSDLEKSKISAQKYGVKYFENIENMAKEVDAIVILTPTPLHYENLKEVLKYDVKVIVDKPLVATSKEAKSIKEFLQNKDVVVTHNYSGYPLVREIRALVKNNILGSVKKVKVNMPQESFFKPMKPGYPQKWRLKDLEIPTIALDLGVHTYHLARFVLNKKFKPFFCEKNSFSKFNVIDDCIVLAKSDDILVELSFSKISLGNSNPLYIEVYGDKAGVKWSQDDFEKLYVTYKDGKREILSRSFAYFEANKARYQRMAPGHPSGFIDAFANLYCDIYNRFNGIKNEFVSDANESIDSILFFKEALC